MMREITKTDSSSSLAISLEKVESMAATSKCHDVCKTQDFFLESNEKFSLDIPASDSKISLTEPEGSSSKNTLEILTEALSKIYSTMSNTLVDQISEQNELQNLDQTMSQILMASTMSSISQQDKLYAEEQADNKALLQKEQSAQTWSKWSQYISLALLVVSIGVSVATAGAAAPEAEVVDAEVTGELEGEELSEGEASETSKGVNSGNGANLTTDEDETVSNSSEEVEQNSKEDLAKSNEELNESQPMWKKIMARLSRMCLGVGMATLNAAPYYFDGKANSYSAQCKEAIANLLHQVGPLVANMQVNTMYFQFYQQLAQRGSQYVQQLGEETSSSVEMDGSIMNAYRQIAVSLSQAA